jgi:hypothetical protein
VFRGFCGDRRFSGTKHNAETAELAESISFSLLEKGGFRQAGLSLKSIIVRQTAIHCVSCF